MRKWKAFFSQTGSELFEVCRAIDRYPDTIIYNTNFGKIPVNGEFMLAVTKDRVAPMTILPNQPRVQDYEQVLDEGDIVTLHGWLRIVPPEICNEFEIYNGHPGLITEYPELKGKDPQAKAYELDLPESGCVIHKVTPEVDDGEVLASTKMRIANMELDAIIKELHDISIELWTEFLQEKFKETE